MVVKVPVAMGLSAQVGRFALWCQVEGKSPRTVGFYAGNLRRFLWYCQKEGFPQEVQDLTSEHLADFFLYVGGAEKRWGIEGNGSERCRPKASRTTLRHYFRTLKVFFAWLVRERVLNESPLFSTKAPKPDKPVIEPYAEDEIRQMLEVCQWDWEHNARFLGSRNKAMILVFLDTGIRRSELEGLRLEDLDLERGVLKVVGKGSKVRRVPVSPPTRLALLRYLGERPQNGEPWLWLTEEGHRLRSTNQVNYNLKARAGITSPGGIHRWRHTMAINYLKAGGDIETLRVILGHEDIAMTHRYLRALKAEDAIRTHARFSPVQALNLK